MQKFVISIFILMSFTSISSHMARAEISRVAYNNSYDVSNLTGKNSNNVLFDAHQQAIALSHQSYTHLVKSSLVPTIEKTEVFTQPWQQLSFSFLNEFYDFSLQPSRQLRVTYNKVRFDSLIDDALQFNAPILSLHYLHLNEQVALTENKNNWFYAGAGFTYFESENNIVNDALKLSAQVGFIAQYQMSHTAMLTFDTKLYRSLTGDNVNFCANELCFNNNTPNVWLQKQVSLQLTVNF